MADGASRIILWDIDDALLAKAKGELSGRGTDAIVQTVDISRLEAVQTAAIGVFPLDRLTCSSTRWSPCTSHASFCRP